MVREDSLKKRVVYLTERVPQVKESYYQVSLFITSAINYMCHYLGVLHCAGYARPEPLLQLIFYEVVGVNKFVNPVSNKSCEYLRQHRF